MRELVDKVSSLEVEVKTAEAKAEALQQERPKTAGGCRSPEVSQNVLAKSYRLYADLIWILVNWCLY